MQFTWPLLLWLLLLIPLLVALYVWMMRRRARYAVRYSSLLLAKQAVDKRHRIKRHIPPILLLLSLTALLIGLARPYTKIALAQTENIVILAIDVSGSMRTRDIEPSRIEAAKAAAQTFVRDQGPNTRIGIVAFSGDAQLVQAPTTDHQALNTAIDRLYPQRATAIGSGILVSLDAILQQLDPAAYAAEHSSAGSLSTPTPVPAAAKSSVPAVIILLTDGNNTTGPLPMQAAGQAVDRGVRVFTIGVGTAEGGTAGGGGRGSGSYGGGGGGGYRTQLDERTLQNVAQLTGGEYFRATDATGLTNIYKDLSSHVVIRDQTTEVTALFTGLAGLFALMSGALSIAWFGCLP
jgi:Ca-activated chloride channel family protein